MSYDRIYYATDAGKITIYTSNDGATYLRHGNETCEELVTLAEAVKRVPQLRDALIKGIEQKGFAVDPVTLAVMRNA